MSHLRFHAPVACALAGAALLGAAPAQAGLPARAPDWQRYVLGPRTQDVLPVRVVSTAGHVDNARALVEGGSGVATLSYDGSGAAPVVLLDYGRDVGGYPFFRVTGATGSPTLHASYSEARRFADLDGDNGGNGPCCGNPAGDPHRYDDYAVEGPGPIVNPAVQGGERHERITPTTPRTLQ